MSKLNTVYKSKTLNTLYKSINPLNNTLFHEAAMTSDAELEAKLAKAYAWYQKSRHGGREAVEDRFVKLSNVHALLEQRAPELAKAMTMEMGKPYGQSLAEVQKCAGHIEYAVKHSLELMADEQLSTRQHKAFVTHQPSGPFLDIVPWNFPLWMPFKSALPPFVLGNPILMKHAPSTPLSAAALEDLFIDAGFDDGEYANLYITNEQAAKVLGDSRIRGVKFTGSTQGGMAVAEVAGRHMKPGCYELGGSDAFIVLADSDLNLAIEKAYGSRMVNNGQACINAKRFIVHESIYDKFRDGLIEKIKTATKMGDPMDQHGVTLGPLAVERLTEELRQQVRDSISQGARLVQGSLEVPDHLKHHGGNFFEPLVLENIKPNTRAYCEELFGPVFSLYSVSSDDQAIELANDTEYGLGAALFTKDIEKAEQLARRLDAGMLYINDFVQSQSDVPSGGVKNSGYGRECHREGLLDLSMSKSIVIERQK